MRRHSPVLPRFRVFALAALLGATSFMFVAAPLPSDPSQPNGAPLPFGLGAKPVEAVGCASNPDFTGHLTDSSSSTTAIDRTTTGAVYGYISNVVTAWSCNSAYRYDGVAWTTDNQPLGNVNWGTLIGTLDACNWGVGSDDYVKTNGTSDCPDFDAEYAMDFNLTPEGNYQSSGIFWAKGDFAFFHSDCSSYYGSEVAKSNVDLGGAAANRPGANCDTRTIDYTPTVQTIAVDWTPPSLIFHNPTGALTAIPSAFYGIQFSATDTVAGVNGWTLTRQVASWSGSSCGSFSNDATSGSVTTGTGDGSFIMASQSLELGKCYQWVLGATDLNGNSASPVTSGTIRTDTSGVLGRQPQFALESWDLGAGDSLAVSTGSGNVTVSHPIVSLPIRGGSLDLALNYNSQDSAAIGLGPGWRLNVQRRLAVNGDGSVTYTAADGSRHTFTSPTGSPTVSYTRPPTLYATLTRDTAATPDRFTLTYRDKSIDIFAEDLANTGLLKQIKDRFGNTVSVAYTAGTAKISTITDPASRSINFSWDGSNRLTSITDWANISAGIVQASGAGNRTYRFFYDGSGYLSGWADPLDTAGTCPTYASHRTCLTYTNGLLGSVLKNQTYTFLDTGPTPDAISSASFPAGWLVAYTNLDATNVKDAYQAQFFFDGTTFAHVGVGQTWVTKPGSPASETRYGLVSPNDSLGRVQSVWRKLDAQLIERRTTYDATYPIEPASITDNYGATPARTVSYTYVASSLGLVSRKTEPLDASNNRTTDYLYNANNDVTQQTVALNAGATNTITRSCYHATTCNTSDADPNLFRQIENYKDGAKGGTNGNAEDVTTEYQYDGFGQKTRETRYNYNAAGTLLDSRATGFAYDTNGNLTAEIANYVNGTVTKGDDLTPNSTTNARTDLTTAYTYDSAGNRRTTADPRRAILAATASPGTYDYLTTWTYDALNQKVSELTPTTPGVSISQRTLTWAYDEYGRIRLATDFGGMVVGTRYSSRGQVFETYEDPDGSGTAYPATNRGNTIYDEQGRVITQRDERQVNDSSLGYTASEYDEAGRLVAQALASGTADETWTFYEYDGLDRQTVVRTGAGTLTEQVTTATYDVGGRKLAIDDEFTCTSRTFDYRNLELTRIEGQASGSCTGSGLRTVTNTYDGVARLATSTVTAGQGLNDKPTDNTFDSAGNTLTSTSFVAATSTTTTITKTVNLLDQVTVEVRSTGTWAKTNYDAAGNATDRCLWGSSPTDLCLAVGSKFGSPQPTSVTTTSYDARNNRLTLVDAVANSTTTYSADHNYLVDAVYLPTGGTKEHQTLYGYDEQHRLVSVTQKLCAIVERPCSGGNTLTTTATDTYTYDRGDNRTRVNENNGSASNDRYYCYDAVNRLLSTRSASGCASGLIEGYAYDDAGNRTTAGSTTFSYDGEGQLSSCSPSCGTVTYDGAGRTSQVNGWAYEYDAQGRMIRACQASSCTGSPNKVEFAYDGDGHRTQTKEYTAGSLAKTWDFRYQGDAVVEEKLTDAAHSSGTVVRTYVVDEGGAVTKLTIPAGETGAGTYLVTWNGHGDAIALWQINISTGALTLANSFTYSTWGTPTTTTHNSIADLGFRFLYVGHQNVQWDNAYGLGLAYMHARHYSPLTGRFLQPDPTAAEANLYGYAGNSPVTRTDPMGAYSWSPNPIEWWACVYLPWSCAKWALASAQAVAYSKPIADAWHENAIRHCMWQCLLTQYTSASEAWFWGEIHEYGSTNAVDSKIDRHNNEVGRLLGQQLKRSWWFRNSPPWAYYFCQQAYRRGYLWVARGSIIRRSNGTPVYGW